MAKTVRVWLVEREYDDKGLVRLVYSTPEGDRRRLSERSANMLRDGGVTAAMDVDPERLDDVTDPETRERYREEVERVVERYEPDDSI
jgi:hypothetical protein